MPKVTVKEDDKTIVICGQDFSVGFDRQGGVIDAIVYKDKNLLASALVPNFWRAPTDNDNGNRMPDRCGIWKNAGPNRRTLEVAVTPLRPQAVRVTVKARPDAKETRLDTVIPFTAAGIL
jgi:beta-galactosidase